MNNDKSYALCTNHNKLPRNAEIQNVPKILKRVLIFYLSETSRQCKFQEYKKKGIKYYYI